MSLINVKDLTFAYDGSYENVFENTSFQIDTDWKLGFVGRNGRGKTTFLNILLGKYKYSGNITASVSFEYFPYEVEDKTKNTIEIFYDICPNCEDWEFMREISLLEVDFDVLEEMGVEVLGDKLIEINDKGEVRHNPYRTALAIFNYIVKELTE